VTEGALGFASETTRFAACQTLADALDTCGIGDPRLDARLLICAAADIDHAELVRRPELSLGKTAARRLASYATRRIAREPVSRILGSRGFWDLDLIVTSAVLDPRPDTETLVEAACDVLVSRREAALRIADLGTGSGALLCALLREFPKATGIGVELSAMACDVARHNLRRCGLAFRGDVIEGDWTASSGRCFDLVVANPPYIATEAISSLAPEVRDYDPWLALDGGADGLAAYSALAALLPTILDDEGVAILEFGAGQGEAVRSLLWNAGLSKTSLRQDFSGQARAIVVFPSHRGRSEA
jgi:release factor glutamine methyltransferase